MTAGAGRAQRPGDAGHVSNNWVPVAAISVLFLGGAVAAVLVDGDTGRIAAYFVVSTLVLVLVTAPWLIRHPPAISARTGAYLVLAVVVELGALLGGAVAAFHGLGAWVVLGIGLAMYGLLERGRVMVTAGVATAVLGLASIVADRPWLTLVLALSTAALIGFAAWRLRETGRQQPSNRPRGGPPAAARTRAAVSPPA